MTSIEPEATPYRDVLESIREELERPSVRPGLAERGKAILASGIVLLRNRQVAAGAVVLVIVLLMIAVASNTRGFGEIAQPPAVGTALPNRQPVTAAPSAAIAPQTTHEIASIPVPAADNSAVKAAPAHPRIAEEKSTPRKRTEQGQDLKKLTIPQLSSALMSGLQSAATKAGGNAANNDDPITIDPSAVSIGRRVNFDFSEQTSGPQRARLIGELPTPRLPNELADIEGEVRVRFSVDTQGRPVMTTVVVETSPSPLLTSAVRAVIPGIRFEPARSGGTDSRAIADVVQIGFHFARNK